MKILIINTVPTEKNGITNVIFNYLCNIEKAGIVFDYVAINEPEVFYRMKVEMFGGKLYVLPRLSLNIFKYWNGLRKLIKKNRYDAVHIHGNSHTLTLELSAVRAAGIRATIVHAHSTSCANIVVHRMFSPIFNRLCNYALACGVDAGRFMFGKRPFMVINNGIDVDKFKFDEEKRSALREQLQIKENDILIGHVGYFQKVKNQSYIVEILRILDEQYKLVLIGDGPQKEDVALFVDKLGLTNRVIFAGDVNNVDEYLCAIDLIVMPSLFEGLPLTLIEQQASGLTCVVSQGITNEVDKTGNLIFLSLEDGVGRWAAEIRQVNVDEKRSEKSIVSIKLIEKAGYSIKDEAAKLYHFYQSI